MQYLSKIYALNLSNQLDTLSDWHQSALDWSNKNIDCHLIDSEKTFYRDYGIERNHSLPKPHSNTKINVANHIRALLDMLVDQEFRNAQGMRDHFIGNEKYTRALFEKIYELKVVSYWSKIDQFMLQEYQVTWLAFKKIKGEVFVLNSIVPEKEWQLTHLGVIKELIQWLSQATNQWILKGAVALYYGYHLDRIPKDLSIDVCSSQNVLSLLKNFCSEKGYDLSIKESSTTQQVLIDYHSQTAPKQCLQVQVSYYLGDLIEDDQLTQINGIKMYTISELFIMMLYDYLNYSRIRDLYDIQFMFHHYSSELSKRNIKDLRYALSEKGIDELDTLILEQQDTLIDPDTLVANFLEMYDQLSLNANGYTLEGTYKERLEKNIKQQEENLLDSDWSLDNDLSL